MQLRRLLTKLVWTAILALAALLGLLVVLPLSVTGCAAIGAWQAGKRGSLDLAKALRDTWA